MRVYKVYSSYVTNTCQHSVTARKVPGKWSVTARERSYPSVFIPGARSRGLHATWLQVAETGDGKKDDKEAKASDSGDSDGGGDKGAKDDAGKKDDKKKDDKKKDDKSGVDATDAQAGDKGPPDSTKPQDIKADVKKAMEDGDADECDPVCHETCTAMSPPMDYMPGIKPSMQADTLTKSCACHCLWKT